MNTDPAFAGGIFLPAISKLCPFHVEAGLPATAIAMDADSVDFIAGKPAPTEQQISGAA
ncbi:hypothetical protein ACLBW8_27615 [Pseudomonas sp. M5A4_2d]